MRGVQYCQTKGKKSVKPGFTLVELIISILILVIGCFAAIYSQLNSLNMSSMSNNQTLTTVLASSEMEYLKSLNFADLEEVAKHGPLTKRFNQSGQECPSGDSCGQYNYTMKVEFFEDIPTSLSYLVEIDIEWLDLSGRHTASYGGSITSLSF